MKVSSLVSMILAGLTLSFFMPSAYAEDAASEQTQPGRDVASKHKGKKKKHGHRGGHHHKRK